MQATVGVINPREVAGAVDKPVDYGTIEGLLRRGGVCIKGVALVTAKRPGSSARHTACGRVWARPGSRSGGRWSPTID